MKTFLKQEKTYYDVYYFFDKKKSLSIELYDNSELNIRKYHNDDAYFDMSLETVKNVKKTTEISRKEFNEQLIEYTTNLNSVIKEL